MPKKERFASNYLESYRLDFEQRAAMRDRWHKAANFFQVVLVISVPFVAIWAAFVGIANMPADVLARKNELEVLAHIVFPYYWPLLVPFVLVLGCWSIEESIK